MSGNETDLHLVSGEVQFFWDTPADDHLLVTIIPDQDGVPDNYELTGAARSAIADHLQELVRIEIEYFVDHHEIVDPDSATTVDGHRPRIVSARLLS